MTVLGGYPASIRESWTRVEMLLALFAKAIEHLDNAVRVIEQDRPSESTQHRTRAITAISVLRSGVNLEMGDLPAKLNQLYEYAQHCVINGDLDKLKSARKVLNELRDGYAAICAEAIALERSGQIPALAGGPAIDVSA